MKNGHTWIQLKSKGQAMLETEDRLEVGSLGLKAARV